MRPREAMWHLGSFLGFIFVLSSARCTKGFGLNAKLLAHVCVQYNGWSGFSMREMDQTVWAILTFQKFSCQKIEDFAIKVSDFKTQPGLSNCVNVPMSLGKTPAASTKFFKGKWLAFCTQPKGVDDYNPAAAKFVDAQEIPSLPASGFLSAKLLVPKMQVNLEIEEYSSMKSIPGLSICNNPRVNKDEQMVAAPQIKVYGHKDGRGSFSAPPGKEDECGGQLLMNVGSNECSFQTLQAPYATPYDGILGNTFVISLCNEDIPKGNPGRVLNVPFHKDPSTLFQIGIKGELTLKDVQVEAWHIWEDQTSMLAPCILACPALDKALTSFETTIEQVIPSAAPQTMELLDSACGVRRCIEDEDKCKHLPRMFPQIAETVANMECSCACKSAFSKPACGHVDLCNPGDCKEDVDAMWSCAKEEAGHCKQVLDFVQSNPKVLECVEHQTLSQIKLPDESTRLYSLNDAFWPSPKLVDGGHTTKMSQVERSPESVTGKYTMGSVAFACVAALGWLVVSIKRRQLALQGYHHYNPQSSVLIAVARDEGQEELAE